MYQIFADGTLIYDSTVEDYKIGKGSGTLETNKAGSFTFSVYPEHFYYDRFVKKKTVIIVKKSEKILFRGRVLDDRDDFWNRREIICEGELNFLQDSIIRPYSFQGTPEEAFVKFVTEHNAQVDEFKRFKIGQVTVLDPNNYIARSNSGYENALKNITSRLQEDSLGGYLHITHGEDGKDPAPTLHYLADFTEISSQNIAFGSNLKDYMKKGSGQAIATAIIPLGAKLDDGDSETEDPRLTIASVNNGVDYVYNAAAVAAHGWIFDTVVFDDVTVASNLKAKGMAYLDEIIRENITVELTAIDLHLLDRSIESFGYDTYVRVISQPHHFAETLLCHKQTFNLLTPENDTVTLGCSISTFTGTAAKIADLASKSAAVASKVTEVRRDVANLNHKTNAYKIAEQRLTSLMAQSFGIFKTEEVLADGSTVHYMHDKPTLAASKNIWKMTGDAFAVSSDGGKTWNAGMDASGNAILNALSVIGIDATWINADNLTALSANLGGWEIKDGAIYKEHTDSSSGIIHRIYIQPPGKYWNPNGTKPFIKIEESNDNGATFHATLEFSDSYLSFYHYDGNEKWFFGQVSDEGASFLNYKTRDLIDIFGDTIKVQNALGQKSYMTAATVYAPSIISGTGKTTNIELGGVHMTFVGGVLVDAYNV